jgi:hypothetical protein
VLWNTCVACVACLTENIEILIYVIQQAIDARKFHFDVDVVRAGVRGVDQEVEEDVLAELERWGCRVV